MVRLSKGDRLVCIKTNDIFDELNDENQRLNSDLVFAQKLLVKLKNVLIRVYHKYNDYIDSEDKQELDQLKNTFDIINETDDQSPSLSQSAKKVKNEVNSRQLPKDYSSDSVGNFTEVENLRQTSEFSDSNGFKSSDNFVEEAEHLRQKFINKEGIFDPKTKLYTCPMSICPKTFHTYNHLYGHLRSVHRMRNIKDDNNPSDDNCFDSDTNSYQCPKPHCGKHFPNKRYLRQHLTRVHTIRPIVVCKEPDCGKSFKGHRGLEFHMRTHNLRSLPKRFICDVNGCEYRCHTKHQLKAHQMSHSSERPFKCTVDGCDRSFRYSKTLRAHSLTHSSEPSLKCSFEECHILFRTYEERTKHTNAVHYRKTVTKKVKKERPLLKCAWPGCDYTTRSSGCLSSHNRSHTGEKPYPCDWPDCQKRFYSLQQLKYHMNIHNNVKPYVCHWPGCHYRSSDGANLRKHVRTTHNTSNSSVIQ